MVGSDAQAGRVLDVVLIGGSGFIGRGLRARLLASGHAVTVVGRGAAAQANGWRHVDWDATSLGPWTRCLEGADVIVHLAGKRVDCRPTRPNVDELITSRTDTVRLVGEAVRRLDSPPSAWIQLSSLAVFGDSGDEVITESSPVPSTGLRQQVEACRRWEAAFDEAAAEVPRTVLLRPGIAIGGAADPATRQLARLARVGLGGPVGSGRQWVSWIDAEDLFDLIHRAVVEDGMAGLYHLTSPEPARNADLMSAYRRAVGRRFGLPSPSVITTLGAWLLGSDPALALTGRRAIPARLLAEGHRFQGTNLDDVVQRAVDAR
ncbi:MAG: epimerase [Acidimicrobiales bacterium]